MYVLRCGVTGELVSPWFWTRQDAELAQGHSELLVIQVDKTVRVPRDLDTSLRARAQRRGRAFDPSGVFWRDRRRLFEERLAAARSNDGVSPPPATPT